MPLTPRQLDRACMVAVLVLSGMIAIGGGVPMIDHTTHRVLAMVDGIPWPQALRPFWNPEPIQAWALRPLSVVLLKLYADVWGPFTVPPVALLRAKIFLSCVALGWTARSWLRVWGFGRAASLASVSVLALSANQFSVYLLPELDTIGAAATLGGCALIARREPLHWRWLIAAPLIAVALLIKESSGLVTFSFLLGGLVACALGGHRTRAVRHAKVLLAGGGLWAWLVSGTLGPSAQTMTRGITWVDRLPITEHNSVQLVSFVGVTGVFVLLLGALARGPLRQHPAHVQAGAIAGAMLLAACPPLVWHDHFAAYYYSPRALASGTALVLWVALSVRAVCVSGTERSIPFAIMIPVGAITAALLIAASPREDLASRLFLATAPALHALVWRSLHELWHTCRIRLASRSAITLLAGACIWWPLATGFNYFTEFRAALSVDTPTRARLAQQPLRDSVVLFNHMVLWIDAMELRAAGANDNLSENTTFAHIPDWLIQPAFPEVDWGEGRLLLEGIWQTGTPVWFVWTAGEPVGMPPEQREARLPDLAWTRRDVGIFTPINFSPGDHAVDRAVRASLPSHNRIEDAQRTRFKTEPTPLEMLVSGRGEERWRHKATYSQVVPQLMQVPRRLIEGHELFESWQYTSRVHQLEPPATATR